MKDYNIKNLYSSIEAKGSSNLMRLKSAHGTQHESVNMSNEMKKVKKNTSISRTHRATKEGLSHKKIKLPLHSRKTSEIVCSHY